MTDLQVLARCPLFTELDDADLAVLAGIAVRRRYEAGSSLFLAGDPPEGLHVVIGGRVRIYTVSPESGRPLILTHEHPNHSVAELPSFDGGAYPANAEADVDTETLLLPQDDFDALLDNHPGLARTLLRTLGRRLRRLVGLIEQLSFQEVVQRLAGHLRDRTAEGLPFRLDTNAEIAATVGTVPELASRNLSRLVQQGLVTLDGRTVVAVDRAGLEALAASARR